MKLRNIAKCNHPNDGTRSLLESVLANEVVDALSDWKNNTDTSKYVLIGGLALSYWVKPRTTSDVDILFLSKADIPMYVDGFKRTRPGAFIHLKTHVEIEVLSPETINMDPKIADSIFNSSIESDGVRIASKSGIIVSKLKRFSRQDQADIENVLNLGGIDFDGFDIPTELKDKLKEF